MNILKKGRGKLRAKGVTEAADLTERRREILMSHRERGVLQGRHTYYWWFLFISRQKNGGARFPY